jgi:hypothetical protein
MGFKAAFVPAVALPFAAGLQLFKLWQLEPLVRVYRRRRLLS